MDKPAGRPQSFGFHEKIRLNLEGTSMVTKNVVVKPKAAKASGVKKSASKLSEPIQSASKATEPSPDPNSNSTKSSTSDLPVMPTLPVIAPETLQALQARYFAQLQGLVAQDAYGAAAAPVADKRFTNPLWQSMPLLSLTKGLYEANAALMLGIADAIETDPQAKARLKFATQQWVDAVSPTNSLLTNPDAQQKLIDTQGESLKKGLENLVGDMTKGRISQSDETAFEVGKNLAMSPGAVVFENELFQLIQYSPSTPKVGKRALLMIPPSINKFYILDLQPENSVVAYTVSQGHTVFMLSWRNVGASQGHLTWDDYLEKGPIEAIKVVRAITGEKQINTLGFCVGGTILSTALAVLAARGEHPAASMTLLTTLLDFSVPGVLGIFIDEQQVQERERKIGQGGLLEGKELSSTFSALRPNDLVWNYVVNNYLMGEKPAAFDLLYWNSDSTNLPGPMFVWYLRHMYLQNELRQPGALTCLGEKVDLRKIKCPVFIYASREDHIVPWESAYMSTQLLEGEKTFVLGASGHIAGVINPAAKNKRSHWVSPQAAKKTLGKAKGSSSDVSFPANHETWFAQAQEHPGSWWPVWSQWLGGFKGGEVSAAKKLGSSKYQPSEAAPGRYVKVRADEAK
jgi:polyhydroxyalkanoate synthase subunit PhaC